MSTASRSTIFGTGLIALDLVLGPDPDTPIRSCAGGTCGNVLSILAYLGWDAYPIARMNGDPASERVRVDMARWGVHLDWIGCKPAAPAPIIVQRIRRGPSGRFEHRFSWSCPHCGGTLPSFRAITLETVECVKASLAHASVFFLDRLSRAAVTLAAEASARGALVVFEPSGRGNEQYAAEATRLAHIVKYADDRLPAVQGVMGRDSATLLEIQTLGERGLRYRHQLGGGTYDWIHLEAVPVHNLADTCGCGDWCTAGLIARVGSGGQVGLREAGPSSVRDALRYGQALAAWNCAFEGARGGMYVVSQEAFGSQIADLLAGDFGSIPYAAIRTLPTEPVPCPACPPSALRGSHGTPL